MEKEISTEEKIIAAAKVEFLAHGMAGARMQDIADRAGINKALLHYYFRNKEKLFEIIFQESFFKIIPQLHEVFNSTDDFFMIIRKFVFVYIQTIGENSFIAPFLAHEINRDPSRMIGLLEKAGGKRLPFEKMVDAYQKALAKGEIIPCAPDMLLTNIISMCVFPFVGKPILQHVLSKDEQAFREFVERRKVEVAEFVIRAIKA
ncbi:MAG: TetR/AcrR family transcriptional regulator [Saprospiraceae bacterium]|nr:TetR/AcrR family transcriptional regulator [Saprospiraceae bacterium]